MPKGTLTGNPDACRPIALGQQDMRMLMTPGMGDTPSPPPPKKTKQWGHELILNLCPNRAC